MQAAIATENLRKRFGPIDAVGGIDMTVPAGSIYGFLGPNGAGKTTTIRLLTGLLTPTSGSMSIFGLPVPKERFAAARLFGALVETPSLYDHLTGRENLEISRTLLRVERQSVERALDLADLGRAGDRRVGTYSLGMRQRLALCRTMLGQPRMLILDEPGNGLDPDGIRDLRAMMRRLAQDDGMTILVSSHQLSEVQQIATHVGLMAGGCLLAQGPVAEVLGGQLHQVEISTDKPNAAIGILSGLSLPASHREGKVIVTGVPETSMPQIIASLVQQGVRLFEVARRQASLEDLYVLHTQGAGRASSTVPAN